MPRIWSRKPRAGPEGALEVTALAGPCREIGCRGSLDNRPAKPGYSIRAMT